MKKLLAMALGLVFTLGLAAQALAVKLPAAPAGKNLAHGQQWHKEKGQGHQQCEFKDFLKQSLSNNKGDLSKVKADVDKLMAEKQAVRESRLKEKAAKEGVTVDQLKARMQEKRSARLEKIAKEHNMTVEQFKAQFQTRHDAKLKDMATELGLSVDQLKQILPTPPQK